MTKENLKPLVVNKNKPVEEVRYIEEVQLPKLSEITNKDGKVKLPPELINKLRNPQSRFKVDLTVFPLQVDYWGDWEFLEIPCVSKDCSVRGDKTPRQWYHANEDCRSSNQYMLWSTKARIKCILCNNASHISNWLFKCHRCPRYGQFDKTKYLKAIKVAHDAQRVNKDFADKLFDYIADNEYEFQ